MTSKIVIAADIWDAVIILGFLEFEELMSLLLTHMNEVLSQYDVQLQQEWNHQSHIVGLLKRALTYIDSCHNESSQRKIKCIELLRRSTES